MASIAESPIEEALTPSQLEFLMKVGAERPSHQLIEEAKSKELYEKKKREQKERSDQIAKISDQIKTSVGEEINESFLFSLVSHMQEYQESNNLGPIVDALYRKIEGCTTGEEEGKFWDIAKTAAEIIGFPAMDQLYDEVDQKLGRLTPKLFIYTKLLPMTSLLESYEFPLSNERKFVDELVPLLVGVFREAASEDIQNSLRDPTRIQDQLWEEVKNTLIDLVGLRLFKVIQKDVNDVIRGYTVN